MSKNEAYLQRDTMRYCPVHERAWYPGGGVYAHAIPGWMALPMELVAWAFRLAREAGCPLEMATTPCDYCEEGSDATNS